jgi:catechol 2,3-dioxygenase-like lactoylglutathione lyase family enzyme
VPIKTTKDSVDVGIVTIDGPAMFAFYRDVLGLEHVRDMPMPAPFNGMMHRFACGTTVVKLVVPERPPGNKPAPGGLTGGTGFRYWTISVANMDEILATAKAAGRPIPVPRTNVRAGVDIAMIEDPDGNWVELVEIREG